MVLRSPRVVLGRSSSAGRLRLAAALTAVAALSPQGASAQQQITVSKARLSRIAPSSAVAADIRVLSNEGTTAARSDSGALKLTRGQLLVLRTADQVHVVPGPTLGIRDRTEPGPDSSSGFHALPVRLVALDAAGTGLWVLRPVYKLSRMRWDPAEQRFHGVVSIAVEDSLRPRESRPLPTPVRFDFRTDGDSVSPGEATIDHTNTPLSDIRVVAARATDSLRVELVPQFDLEGTDVWLRVEPSLQLRVSPPEIQGWGLETAQVIVRVLGTTVPTPIVVGLVPSAGHLDTMDVGIGAGGSGFTSLRSSGIGAATLTASAPGFGQAATTVTFTWPWIFFLAAVLGGVFGGLGGTLVGCREEKVNRPWARNAAKGAFAGVFVAVVWYGLGVNLLQFDLGIPRQNEIAVFALAALAAFFGAPRVGSGQGRGAAGTQPAGD